MSSFLARFRNLCEAKYPLSAPGNLRVSPQGLLASPTLPSPVCRALICLLLCSNTRIFPEFANAIEKDPLSLVLALVVGSWRRMGDVSSQMPRLALTPLVTSSEPTALCALGLHP